MIALKVGDIGRLNINLSPEEQEKGVGYLGMPPDTEYEICAVNTEEAEITVMQRGDRIIENIGSVDFPYGLLSSGNFPETIPQEFFNKIS